MSTKFRLGDMVRGGPRLRRQHVPNTSRKVWEPFIMDKKMIEGMFIGSRTYYNGTVDYADEYGCEFNREESLKIALIVRTERENPIPVLFDSLELTKEPQP